MYDLKNIWNLMRYLLPQPPVPQRFLGRMLAAVERSNPRDLLDLDCGGVSEDRLSLLPSIKTGPQAAEILHPPPFPVAPRD
jgi:hypothetical protein